MLKIEKNVTLAPYTTFRIGAQAEFFAVVKNEADVRDAILWAKKNKRDIFVLGGGSNILITKKIRGLVIKNEIKGMTVINFSRTEKLVEAFSGEAWTKFVDYTIKEGLSGLENLFLIYGTVGAAPIQNIGAYGVELKDVFEDLVALDLKTGKKKTFKLADCRFGYRDSIFKNRYLNRYFILSVRLRLSRTPKFKLDYGAIREELSKKGITKPTAREVVAAITAIRNSKLPNPGTLPNAGSYFKNVTVSVRKFETLKKTYPLIPAFPAGRNKMKIATGWLIEQAGFKGRQEGPVSMYAGQALILVSHGSAQARDVLRLAAKVKRAVKLKFGLEIEEEVGVI